MLLLFALLLLAPPAQTPQDDPPIENLRQHPEVTPPKVKRQVKAKYTKEAKKEKVEGTVVVKAVVEKDGHIRQTEVISSMGYGLDEAAVAAVKQWIFEPATKGGQPVRVYAQIPVTFRLVEVEKERDR